MSSFNKHKSAKRRRRSSASKTTSAGTSAVSARIGPSWDATGDAAASSPFGQRWRRRPGRATKKYGSRRGHAVEPVPPAAAATSERTSNSADADPVTVEDLVDPLRGTLPPAVLSRTEQVLRAYANVLEAAYAIGSSSSLPSRSTSDKGKERERVPSLAEVAAREIGATLEDQVRACLDLASSTPSGSSDSEASDEETSRASLRGGMSAQEAQLEASALQDEWYEACPPSVWR